METDETNHLAARQSKLRIGGRRSGIEEEPDSGEINSSFEKRCMP
jgi:hypothetical protein